MPGYTSYRDKKHVLKHLLYFAIALSVLACKKQKNGDGLSSPPTPTVFLKDAILSNLPSPYYHFEYDADGKIIFVSFASEFFRYNIIYDGNRISEMRNNILVNKDRLQYRYDNQGKVSEVDYADSTGLVYVRLHFFYDGQKLVRSERERKSGSTFIQDRIVTMSYYADGNLLEQDFHYPATPFNGQIESNYAVRYEQYDNKINADGFGLLHTEFFDHLVLLPGVQLQKNNPGKEIRNGDGDDYVVDYTYTYNDHDAPLTKSGEVVFTSGPNAGQQIHISSSFSYY
jgi:hypothetical protein